MRNPRSQLGASRGGWKDEDEDEDEDEEEDDDEDRQLQYEIILSPGSALANQGHLIAQSTEIIDPNL